MGGEESTKNKERKIEDEKMWWKLWLFFDSIKISFALEKTIFSSRIKVKGKEKISLRFFSILFHRTSFEVIEAYGTSR